MLRGFSLAIALATLVVTASPVVAAPQGATLAYARTTDSLTLTVAGRSPRTGSWQVEARGLGRTAGHRVIVVLVASDVSWTGVAATQDLRRGRWITTGQIDLEDLGPGTPAQTLAAPWLGLVLDTDAITPPVDGSRTMTVRFAVTSKVRVRVSGAVRLAVEPFVLGRLVPTRTAVL